MSTSVADIPPKWLAWAADLLYLAAQKFANHGRNDIDWPDGWTDEDKAGFLRAIAEWSGNDADLEEIAAPGHQYGYDWLAMYFLGEQLRPKVTK